MMDKKKEKRALAEEMGAVFAMAELRALSTASQERPLSEREFARMMQLKKELTGE